MRTVGMSMVSLGLCFTLMGMAPPPLSTAPHIDKEITEHETKIIRRAYPNSHYIVSVSFGALDWSVHQVGYAVNVRNGRVPFRHIESNVQMIQHYCDEIERVSDVDMSKVRDYADLIVNQFGKFKKANVMKAKFFDRSQKLHKMLVGVVRAAKNDYKWYWHELRHDMWVIKTYGRCS